MSDVLAGCTATPLAGYLKAIGLLRLLSIPFPGIRAAWRSNTLALHGSPGLDEVERFLLGHYCPTAVLAPWNGGSGFYFQERKSSERDPVTGKRQKLGVRDQTTEATRTLDTIASSRSTRFEAYREAIVASRRIVSSFGLKEAPKGIEKDRLVLRLRAELPDACLEWLDASLVVTTEGARFPPLLGTGGNDGNLDFTSNFMQRLIDVLGTDDDETPPMSSAWLQMAVRGVAAPGLVQSNIGQFSPGRAGGPNGTAGFSASSAVNPWDFVLMIEGALPFAAAAGRRNADDPEGVLSYPFTVKAVSAGAGSLGETDSATSRGELWMPLWSNPASYAEVHALLAEGRVALGRKPARDALDFVRAVHHLGGYRGVDRFQRYGLLMRAGKAYLATPLTQVVVARNPSSDWLDELDQDDWLTTFRGFAQGDSVGARLSSLRRRLEDAVFDLSGRPRKRSDIQLLLILLGQIHLELARSRSARESVPPLRRLSERWIVDDGSAEYRIARALAGLHGVGQTALPLRAQLFPVHPKQNEWMDAPKGPRLAGDPASRLRLHTESRVDLVETLVTLLERRLWLAEQLEMSDKPLDSAAAANLDDLTAFLRGEVVDERIRALMFGLSLCRIPRDVEANAGVASVPVAFALLKLCATPDSVLQSLDVMDNDRRLPMPAGVAGLLRTGNIGNRAVILAWRRLRASGLSPAFDARTLPELRGIDPCRAAAALLIPLRYGATGMLARSALFMTTDAKWEATEESRL